MTTPPKTLPAGAVAALADRGDTPSRAAARDELHAVFDALGDRPPTAEELRRLLRLADSAFTPKSAAWRLTAALVRALGER